MMRIQQNIKASSKRNGGVPVPNDRGATLNRMDAVKDFKFKPKPQPREGFAKQLRSLSSFRAQKTPTNSYKFINDYDQLKWGSASRRNNRLINVPNQTTDRLTAQPTNHQTEERTNKQTSTWPLANEPTNQRAGNMGTHFPSESCCGERT